MVLVLSSQVGKANTVYCRRPKQPKQSESESSSQLAPPPQSAVHSPAGLCHCDQMSWFSKVNVTAAAGGDVACQEKKEKKEKCGGASGNGNADSCECEKDDDCTTASLPSTLKMCLAEGIKSGISGATYGMFFGGISGLLEGPGQYRYPRQSPDEIHSPSSTLNLNLRTRVLYGAGGTLLNSANQAYSYGVSFGVSSGIQGGFHCLLHQVRGENRWNGPIAAGVAGALVNYRGGMKAMVMGAGSYALFAVAMQAIESTSSAAVNANIALSGTQAVPSSPAPARPCCHP